MKFQIQHEFLQEAEIMCVHHSIAGKRYTVKTFSLNWPANFPMMQIEPLMVTKIKKGQQHLFRYDLWRNPFNYD